MSKFTPNSFQLANAFVDEAMCKLSDAAVKIYIIIVRKTRGWMKEMDAISLTQLEEFSGKSHPTVVRCIKELVEVGLIKKHHQSKYGNVYSALDNYDVGEFVRFPKRKALIQEFVPYEHGRIKNSQNFGYGQKPTQFYLKVYGNKTVLVKNFNYLKTVGNLEEWLKNLTTLYSVWLKILTRASKNFLLQTVKNFNLQKQLSKTTIKIIKNTWLDSEKLKSRIESITHSVNPEQIFNASWFNLELEMFDEYNADKNHSDKFKMYYFAEWLIKAYFKYEEFKNLAQLKQSGIEKTKPAQMRDSKKNQPSAEQKNSSDEFILLTPKQIRYFAGKLAADVKFASEHAQTGESTESFVKRLTKELCNPSYVKKVLPSLEANGFKHLKRDGIS